MHGVLDLGLAGPGPETGRQLWGQPVLVDVAGPTSMQTPDYTTTRGGAVERGTPKGRDDIGLPILRMGQQEYPTSPLTFRKRGSTLSSLSLDSTDRQTPPGRAEAEARCKLEECERKGARRLVRKRAVTAREKQSRKSLMVAGKKKSPHGVSGPMLGASGRCDGSLSVRGE